MARLEVEIGANSSELNAEIAAAESKIERLRKQKAIDIKLGMPTVELQKNINEAKSKLADLKKSVDNTGSSFAGMTPKVANGGNALMQFSRIAQDAPYGIIGIGNNITSTVEAFGHLKNSTGSTGGALKALAGSIMGSGGILLAVSLVTTAFTYMAQNGLSVGDVYDKLTGIFDEAKKALIDLGVEAAKTAGSEISSMNALVSVAQNDIKSRKDRITAVKELQDMYPAYFGNLSQEKILNGDLTGIVRNLSTALKERARASALSGKAGELASKELGTQEELRSVYQDIFKLLGVKGSADQLKVINDLNKDNLVLTNARFSALKTMSADEILTVGHLKNKYTDLRNELKSLGSEMNHIQSLANKSAGASVKLLEDAPKKGAKGAVKRPDIVALPKLSISKGTDEENDRILAMFRDQLSTDLNNLKNEPIALNIPIQPVLDLTPADLEMQRLEGLLADFNAGANELITGSIADTFGQLGTSIGEALATGGNVFKAIGNTILSSIGKFLSDMGGMLIKYGTMAVIKGKLDIAIATGGPAAIVAGIAAIGVGVALKAIGGAIGAKASGQSSGGGGGGSYSTGASYSSPSASNSGSGSGSFSGGSVVFEISGQSLIGVLSNTLDKNRRLGGALAL